MRLSTLEILVVDDTEEYLNSLEAILQVENFIVRTSNNGRSALKSIKIRNPGLILMDVDMPELNGIKTLQKIREQYSKTWIPVILMSANASMNDQLQGYAAGCDEFLAKPTDPRLLLAKIKVFQRILQFTKIPA